MKPTEAAEALGRLTAWIRDYGDQKQPEFIADLQAVLDAVRQELLPLLDEGEITEEWLREMGGRASGLWFEFNVGGWCVDLKRSDFAPRQWAVRIEDEGFPDVATRGQLRLLLAALEGKL